MMLSSLVGSWDVMAAGIEAPTIDKVFYDATTISGAGVHKERINRKNVFGVIHVTLKNGNTVKASSTINPTSTKWTYKLPNGTSVAEGDVVTAYQEFNGQNSPEVTANAEPSMAYNHKNDLKMPSGEIWIEQTSSNQVNKDEQAEAVEMFKNVNAAIAGDTSTVKFSINGTEHAYYEVTYTDGSKSDKIEAKDLKIKQVTETSAALTIEKVQVTDGQIVVTLENEVAKGTKFYFVSNFTDGEESGFCKNGSCIVDKSTSKEMSQAVSIEGKKVTFQINATDDLELGKEFGIVVKEPHKFRSCAKKEPVVTTPAKVNVRDPHKLTDADKKAIDKAIRDANTVNGKSKLPNSREGEAYPALIDFDKDGNARIIDPNYVKGEWDWENYPDGKFIPEQNADGTYKVKDEYQDKVTSIPAKDLVKNIKPIAPVLKEENDKVIITPNKDDTDIAKVTVKYKDKNNQDQTVEITKTEGNWTIPADSKLSVDSTTGLFTFDSSDVINGGTVTAQFTDNGGLTEDEKPLPSDETSIKLAEKVDVTFAGNGGGGSMDKETIKKGSTYKLPANGFTAPKNKVFDGWMVGTEKKSVGDTITVNADTEVKAVWKDIEHKVTFNGTEGSGKMDEKVVKQGEEYTLPANGFTAPKNKVFDGWMVGTEKKSVGDTITVNADTEVKAV
ncbi:hypothetical protein, partial [Peptoniphilus duerdenii]|uniref:hypothetical protein n=1 Tax=Peptoniphilus duerdenii TaxID=507750 RepID=UPI00254DDEB9